ncbi:MAG: MOSC domain-containing protein [Alphaproteobacteria bacterium]|nr:MOSC domain-containing protein [Alphaproteobacteria bacterium]
MKLLSVNVAMPRSVTWGGRTYATSIFKQPVEGRVTMRRLNIDGDAQSDLTVHGGADMAVYVYSDDHYPYWRTVLTAGALTPGAFGENLTVTGMTEETVHIGDSFAIGDALVQVSEPRTPCHKLAMKYDRPSFPKEFLRTGHVGFYLRVLEPGEVGAGDEITPVARDSAGLTVMEILRIWEKKRPSAAELDRALSVPALSAKWRGQLAERR